MSKKGSPKNNTNDIQGWQVKEPVTLPGKKAAKRVDLNPDDFDNLLKEKGVRVKVYRTMFCPNVKSIDGGEHNIDCTSCNGSGFLDVRPICTVAFLQNQSHEKLPFVEGMVDGNSVAATFPIGIELQYFTLVELIDFTEIYYQRVQRQEGDVDVLKYKACRINVVIGSDGKEYFQGTDFVLNDDGSIKWKANRGPDPKAIYSVHYEAAVQFRAVSAMHSNRFTQIATPEGIRQIKMPEQWLLQKEFLVKRVDRDGNEIGPNTIKPIDED